MADIEINDLASIGVVKDVKVYQLPPEAFSSGNNVRLSDQGIEVIGGREQVFGTPSVAPHFIMPIANATQTFWIYTSLTKAYGYDGITHTNITRQTASVDVDYTAGNTRDWNGTLFGGVPIINNGSDVPQYWSSLSLATKLAGLSNWPALLRARVLRSFGPYLMAFHLTDNSVVYPHLIQWSHPADPGSLPSSWDYTDPTLDAGRKDLTDVNAGVIQDALPLGGRMFVYKEGSVWRVTAIGGQFIFDFKEFLETAGLLAPRCVSVTGDGKYHIFATQDDIMFHNGTSAESLLLGRYKKYLFNQIDTTNYKNCFMFTNAAYNEVWFCYPELGLTNPNRALIWNYGESKGGGFTEADVDFRNAAAGVIESASGETWASASGAWVDDNEPWASSLRRKVVLCGTDATKLYQMDAGSTFDGDTITATLAREGLAVEGRKRTGEWIVNYQSMKFTHRLWIKASGGPVSIRVGFSELVDGSVTWTSSQEFDPASQLFLDFEATGRALAIEFTATVPFRLEGYKFQGKVTGGF